MTTEAINPSQRTLIERAISDLDGVELDLTLPAAVVSAHPPRVWRSDAPGKHVGHMLAAVGYNRDGLIAIAWGQPVLITWQFFRATAHEPVAAVLPTGLRRTRLSQIVSLFNNPGYELGVA